MASLLPTNGESMNHPITEKSTCIYDVIGGASPDYTLFGLVNKNTFGGKLENVLCSPKGRTTKEMCDLFEARYQHDYSIISNEFRENRQQNF